MDAPPHHRTTPISEEEMNLSRALAASLFTAIEENKKRQQVTDQVEADLALAKAFKQEEDDHACALQVQADLYAESAESPAAQTPPVIRRNTALLEAALSRQKVAQNRGKIKPTFLSRQTSPVLTCALVSCSRCL